jgi:excisionase family DNA binding protein
MTPLRPEMGVKKLLQYWHPLALFGASMHAHLALTVKQVARGMGVGERAVRGWIARGELPAFNIGPNKGTRISVRAVENFMQQRTFNAVDANRCQQMTATDSL